MIISKVLLRGFRNHESLCYQPSDGVNIIYGPNGRGKTNLLEGIYLLTGAKSWRAAHRREMIGWGAERAFISASVTSRSRHFELAIDIPVEGKARAVVNGIPAGRENPLGGVLRAVLFSPEDLQLVKGAPTARRELMDSSLSQLWPRYAPLLARYSRLVLGKGRLLRGALERGDGRLDVLPEINAQMAALGAKIIRFRAEFCREMSVHAARIHSEISSNAERLELEYRTDSAVADAYAAENEIEGLLLEHLERREQAERASASCLVGVHRDDVEILINGKPARAFASQGQARSAALAIRFAQRELFYSDIGEYPLLLLDDILSELDDARRDYVCRNTLGGQSIITCCGSTDAFFTANIYQM